MTYYWRKNIGSWSFLTLCLWLRCLPGPIDITGRASDTTMVIEISNHRSGAVRESKASNV